MSKLASRTCVLPNGDAPSLLPEECTAYVAEVPDWTIESSPPVLTRTFRFDTFDTAVSFVNAVAFVARGQDHHPDLDIRYSRVTVRYWTHAAGGLTVNDFICAAKIDRLLR